VIAELYALTHRGNAGDIAFYNRFCRGARSVLELGSGSGRMLAGLAAAERRVIGLELDPQLLALAQRTVRGLSPSKRKSLRLVPGDMRDFELEERVERVILPYNALYCLLTQRAALACFRATRRALDVGGLFALDVWNAAPFQHGLAEPDDVLPIVCVRHAGRTWDVFEKSRVQRSRQRIDVIYSYVPRDGKSVVRIPIAQRYFLAKELTDLLGRAGFVVEARYGAFSRTRFSSRSPQLIVVARAT
jgi:SAM-dependent methyltransferase